jgi:pyruvate carboxylase subunit B
MIFLDISLTPKTVYVSSLLISKRAAGRNDGKPYGRPERCSSGNQYGTGSSDRLRSEDELLIKLFDEVAYIWPMMGYPPLVTPFSQYVKNTALVNVLSLAQGRERFETIDDNTWDMLLGKAGHLPGEIDPVFKNLHLNKTVSSTQAFHRMLFPMLLTNTVRKWKKRMGYRS